MLLTWPAVSSLRSTVYTARQQKRREQQPDTQATAPAVSICLLYRTGPSWCFGGTQCQCCLLRLHPAHALASFTQQHHLVHLDALLCAPAACTAASSCPLIWTASMHHSAHKRMTSQSCKWRGLTKQLQQRHHFSSSLSLTHRLARRLRPVVLVGLLSHVSTGTRSVTAQCTATVVVACACSQHTSCHPTQLPATRVGVQFACASRMHIKTPTQPC